MDGRGGCCIARYAAAGGHAAAAAYDMSQMDRIMLKFRPIAPKPAAAGAAPAASDGGSDGHGKAASGGRGRRKGCKDGNGGCGGGSNGSRRCTNVGRKRKSCSPDQTAGILPDHHDHDQKAVMTLPLLPESPDLSPTAAKQPHKMPFWLSFNSSAGTVNTPPGVQDNYGHSHSHCHVAPDPTVTISPRHHHHHNLNHSHNNHVVHQSHPVVKSCVIVEGITDTCPPEGVARDVRALEKDTCPVIISDGWNRVVWANEAYRRMVGMGDTWRDRRMAVSVEMRERVPERVQTFTCRVRVHRSNGGKDSRGSSSSSSASFPCDVWRIDGGGFAWRLDVDAALSLGFGGK